jgi:hypothetical protein
VTFRDTPLPASFEVQPIAPLRKPRHKFTEGRRPGSQNKFTRDIKNAVLQAAHNVGDDRGQQGLTAYLEDLARHHKRAFAALLAKMMPLSVDATTTSTAVNEVRILSVPVGVQLTPENIAKLSPMSPLLEHTPAAAAEPAARAVEAEAMPVSIEEQVKAELKSMTAMLDGFIRERT